METNGHSLESWKSLLGHLIKSICTSELKVKKLGDFGHFSANSDGFCGQRGTLWSGNPSWAVKTLLWIFWQKRVVDYWCNSCRIPWQSGTCYFGVDFGWVLFWPIQCVFVFGEPFCGVGNPFWDLMTLGHLMTIKWLVADVIAVGSPDRAEHAILGVVLVRRVFGQFRPFLWSKSHFVV